MLPRMKASVHTFTRMNDSLHFFAKAIPFEASQSYLVRQAAQSRSVVFAGYIGEFEIIDDHRAGKIVVNLTGRLNKCGVISPRFDVQLKDLEKWQNNLLPSRQFGFIVLTTSAGIMDHEEARRKHTGGKILGFFF
uniref:Small ribosomal subunit protein uS8 n=1 Tax=Cyprinus carpio carpio TaxID=630221 RepID=A0A9J7ZPA1_CYPCA